MRSVGESVCRPDSFLNIHCILIVLILAIIFLTLTCAVAVAVLVSRWQRLSPYNQRPLDIPTFDSLNCPYHPSVLFFPDGWNGWRYWMVETPFSPDCKPYVDRNECPSIHVSRDGRNWTVPQGLKNPIVDLDCEGVKTLDYYSDPHLVMNDNGRLECWYRLTRRYGDVDSRHHVSLRKVVTSDGSHWSEEKVLCQLDTVTPDIGLGPEVVSPALINRNGVYRIWYVDKEDHTTQRGISTAVSTDEGESWHHRRQCTLNSTPINPWHIDVAVIDDIFWLTVYDAQNLTLWRSTDGVNFSFIRELLRPGAFGSFYCQGLYRACLVDTDEGARLYFSARDHFKTYLGLMQGATPDELQISSPTTGNHKNILQYVGYHCRWQLRRFTFIITHFINFSN